MTQNEKARWCGIALILTALCDVLVFKQKLTKKVFLALVFAVAGIVLTNII